MKRLVQAKDENLRRYLYDCLKQCENLIYLPLHKTFHLIKLHLILKMALFIFIYMTFVLLVISPHFIPRALP